MTDSAEHAQPQTPGVDDQAEGRLTVVQRIFSASPQGVMQAAGVVLTFVAAFAFAYGIYGLIKYEPTQADLRASGFNFWRDVFGPNFKFIAIAGIGMVCALFSVRLFSKAGSLTSQVIRKEEAAHLWPLIERADRDAVNEYIRLASLSGFSGTFTKLGFTGLPLATVTLTLLLLAIALVTSDAEMQKSVFDMAKLTLGAFLGSFVQRNIEQEKLVGHPSAGGTGDGGGKSSETDGSPADRRSGTPLRTADDPIVTATRAQ